MCAFLFTSELIEYNPMPLIGRPKVPKSLPKGLGAETVSELLAAIDADRGSQRRSDWPERDAALVLTAVLTGLRADELLRANIGDIRTTTDDGGVIHVRGKGNKDRRIPVEAGLIKVIERYLDSRATRFPADTKRRGPSTGIGAWPATAALFVGSEGDRITRGVLQYRVLRAFKKAGLDNQRARGALVHGLRHTFATELANSDVSVYALMKLLGHESMVTSQRYVDGAGTQNRAAAAQNPLYGLIEKSHEA
ncbi:tyrosine-type recombinase/integrase [Mycobacterium sp. MFM001]|uniref:tyrosine-type recombinase/integrase n=1 Tax=Mycobacterium sp. MFM001 TaxID=2049453 RepID=UPI00352CED83